MISENISVNRSIYIYEIITSISNISTSINHNQDTPPDPHLDNNLDQHGPPSNLDKVMINVLGHDSFLNNLHHVNSLSGLDKVSTKTPQLKETEQVLIDGEMKSLKLQRKAMTTLTQPRLSCHQCNPNYFEETFLNKIYGQQCAAACSLIRKSFTKGRR